MKTLKRVANVCRNDDMCLATFAVNYGLLSGSVQTGLLDDVPESACDCHVTHDYGGIGGSHENGFTDEESDNDDNHILGASDANVTSCWCNST